MSQEMEQLKAQFDKTDSEKKDLEAKLKAMEDEDKKKGHYKSKLAKYASIFKGMEEKDREDMIAKYKAAMSDDEHDKADMKAMEENHEEMKSKKGMEHGDDDKKELKLCLQVTDIELDGGQALLLPFREREEPARSRIRFGS